MIYSIYQIKNIINGKIYIGYSQNPISRWKNHKHSIYKPKYYKSKLYSAMNKYGIENFQFDVIYQSYDKAHCKEIMEPYFIAMYNTIEEGYNIAKGGSGGSTRNGMKWTDTERANIAEKTKLAMTLEVRSKISKSRKGTKASYKTKKLLSDSHKNLRWISNLTTHESKFVQPDQFKMLKDAGWIPGRKFSNPWSNSKTNFKNKAL